MQLLQIITKDNSEILKNILTSLAILIGGGWTFWNFVLRREKHSKIQFNVDLQIIGIHKDKFIIEVIAIVENKGLVRHYVNDFRFDLLYLDDKQDIIEGDDRINKQVLFKKLIDKRYWIPPNWYNSFIDAGITQYYNFTTYLPGDAKFAIVYGHFKYPDKESSFHTAHKTFPIQVPKTTDKQE